MSTESDKMESFPPIHSDAPALTEYATELIPAKSSDRASLTSLFADDEPILPHQDEADKASGSTTPSSDQESPFVRYLRGEDPPYECDSCALEEERHVMGTTPRGTVTTTITPDTAGETYGEPETLTNEWQRSELQETGAASLPVVADAQVDTKNSTLNLFPEPVEEDAPPQTSRFGATTASLRGIASHQWAKVRFWFGGATDIDPQGETRAPTLPAA